ncbi:MAG TPA: IMP cyclohydrolase [Candidatus Hydrogenedentes bacterium]|nr:IMP cyclohydrolase [Candidatus Hydrogenedentota bacterium]
MYVGRIVSVARTTDGRLCGVYRVSSRSFPNRSALVGKDKVSIVPKAGHEGDVLKNPYIAYNCVRVVRNGDVAVVTNGSQTDVIAEKIENGMPALDAVALASLMLDYEKDAYNTPRISAVVDKSSGAGWLGIVRHDGLQVERIPLEFGRLYYVATYEESTVCAQRCIEFPVKTAEEACDFILGRDVFAERDNPVTAVAAMAADYSFTLMAKDAPTTGG